VSLNLPKPASSYDYDNEVETRRQLAAADGENLKRDQNIQLQPDQKFILIAPDGGRWAIVVDNAGNLSAAPA
jgi:hypothetical protein